MERELLEAVEHLSTYERLPPACRALVVGKVGDVREEEYEVLR